MACAEIDTSDASAPPWTSPNIGIPLFVGQEEARLRVVGGLDLHPEVGRVLGEGAERPYCTHLFTFRQPVSPRTTLHCFPAPSCQAAIHFWSILRRPFCTTDPCIHRVDLGFNYAACAHGYLVDLDCFPESQV